MLIAGVGALGCEVAKNLTMMGIGNLILVDNDKVELSNTSRQMLFSDGDIGQSKVDAAARKLKIMNPHVNVEIHDSRIEDLSEEVYEEADLLVGGLDNWSSRRFLNSVSVQLKRPYVDGGTFGLLGNVQVVTPLNGACLECYGVLLGPKEEMQAECTLHSRRPEDLWDELRLQKVERLKLDVVKDLFEAGFKTVRDLKYAKMEELLAVKNVTLELAKALLQRLKPNVPACLTVNAIIGGIQAHETLKILMRGKIGLPIKNFLQFDGMTGRFTCLELLRNEDCVVCGSHFRLEGIEFGFNESETVLSLKRRLAEVLGYPDVELQYRAKLLDDGVTLETEGITNGEILFMHSTRLYKPLRISLRAE